MSVTGLQAALVYLYLDIWWRLSRKRSRRLLLYAIILGVVGLIVSYFRIRWLGLELRALVGFGTDGLYLLTQVALIGSALKGYSQVEATASKPVTPVTAQPINQHWLWAVRIAALVGPLIFLGSILSSANSSVGAASDDLFGALLTLAAVAPAYVHILWRLAGPKYKKGLASTVTTGSAVFLISSAFWVATLVTPKGESGGAFGGMFAMFMMLSEALLVGFAIKTYHLMRREVGDASTLVLSMIPTAIYLVWSIPLLFVAWLTLFKPHMM